MGDVVDFDGTTTQPLSAEKVLDAAKKDDPDEVIVISRKGERTTVAATSSDVPFVFYMLESAKRELWRILDDE